MVEPTSRRERRLSLELKYAAIAVAIVAVFLVLHVMGAFSGVKEARHEVIRDADAWEKFWKQHSVSGSSAEKIPAVDFAKEMVLAATMGTKRTVSGWHWIRLVMT